MGFLPSPPPYAGGGKAACQMEIDVVELSRLFGAQCHHLDHFFDHLDLPQVAAFAQAFLDAPGTVFFSGVGKSGIVTHKLSQTLASLGLAFSAFLPPVDALHGDIGALFPGGLLVLLSTSSSSDKLLGLVLVPALRGHTSSPSPPLRATPSLPSAT